MANKRYDEFSAGTYDTAKIFLQGDPSTGALEKVNLPLPGNRYCKLTAAALINANNSGSNPQTVATLNIPADTINTNADIIEVTVFGRGLTGSGTKEFKIAWNTNNLTTYAFSTASLIQLRLWGIRSSSSNFIFFWQAIRANAFDGISNETNRAADFTISNDFIIKVTSGAANDILMLWAEVKIFASV